MYLFKLFAMLSNYTAVTRLAQQKQKSYYVQVTCINYSPIQYSVKFTPSPLITATPLTPVLREHIDKSSYRRMPGECRGTMLMMLISLMDTLAWWMWITKANVFSFFSNFITWNATLKLSSWGGKEAYCQGNTRRAAGVDLTFATAYNGNFLVFVVWHLWVCGNRVCGHGVEHVRN